jgi:dephospho-CoA kinase
MSGQKARMIKVGVTGGIGSGKTIVCRVFAALGIPVFSADDAARYLQEHDPALRESIIQLLGGDAYLDGMPNRPRIAELVFADPAKLQQLNALVHPATIEFADSWMRQQTTPYVIKEAAIFFESGTHKDMDIIVGVYAPKELRIARAMQRGAVSREKVESIMARQMDDDKKMSLCDHVVVNDDATALLPQVLRLHELFLIAG